MRGRVSIQPLDDAGEPVGAPFDATIEWDRNALYFGARTAGRVSFDRVSILADLTASLIRFIAPESEPITDPSGKLTGWRMPPLLGHGAATRGQPEADRFALLRSPTPPPPGAGPPDRL
jgi:hypothetical protein